MERFNQNPYASPTDSSRAIPAARLPGPFDRPYIVANISLCVSVVGTLVGWGTVAALLSVGLWSPWTGLSAQSGYRLLDVIAWNGVAFVMAGVVACVVCAVFGTWLHRIAIAFLAVLYVPLVTSIWTPLLHKLLLL